MHKQGPTIEYHQPLSAAGCMLCALYFVILAVLPLIPSQITRVLKPAVSYTHLTLPTRSAV